MRLKLLLALIVMSGTGSALSAGTAELGFAAIPQCLGPSDMSEYLQRIVRAIVSATDSDGVKVRAALQVPLMRPSAVALVANASTCSRAAQAMNVAQDTLIADRRLYVFALGDSLYGVVEESSLSGGDGPSGPGSGTVEANHSSLYLFRRDWTILSIALI
jgi:hypothetical protein